MSRSFLRQSVLHACAPLLVAIFTSNLLALQPKVLAPHKPVAPTVTPQPNWSFPEPTQRSMVGGVWMIDANFRSTLYLKNGVKNAAIKATPILYLSNGKSFTLSDVQLEPSATAVVNLNDELNKQGIASWATLSGYVEVKYNHAWNAICVTLQDVDTVHSLIFTYKLQPSSSSTQVQAAGPAQESQTLDGMWWKQESNVTGFVALSNVLAQPIRANIQVSDSQGKLVKEHVVTVSPHGTKIVKLNELQFAPSSEGGINVNYQGPNDGLLINGGLEDPSTGYSATLRLYPVSLLLVKPPAQGYGELGLMAGAADPMMSFPAETVFTPYSVIRNITDQPIGITPVLWWMEAGGPHSARLTQFALQSHSTQTLPVDSLLAQAGLKNFNGTFNLILEADAKVAGLLMSSGSVDQRNTYVFEVPPQGIGESASKSLSYWSTGKGDDTMITIWNPADEEQNFVFTLSFSGGSYKYPVLLGPRATRSFNVSEIIHNQLPDVDGSLVPLTVHEGSAEIAGSSGETEGILVGITAGIYNVQKATCGNPCTTCNGISSSSIQIQPFGVKIGGTIKESLIGTWNTGTQQDFSSVATWSSSNTAIATALSPGNVKGVSSGTFRVIANDPDYYLYDSCVVNGPCPQGQVNAGGGGTVFQVTNVAPAPLVVGTSGPMAIGGSGFSSFAGAPSVTLSGSGVTVMNASVANDSQITASYSAASNAPLGSRNLTVTFTGADGAKMPSNPFPVTVTSTSPVPASASIDSNVKQTYSNQTWTSCDGTESVTNAYGYQRCVTYQVNDKNNRPIYENLTIAEAIEVVDPGNITSNMHTGNRSSNAAGQFLDGLALFGKSVLQSNACQIVKQSITATGNSNPIRVNCIQYSSTDVMVTDVSSHPALCVKGTTYHCN